MLKFRVNFSAGSRNQQISCVSSVSKLNFKLLKHFFSNVFLVKMKVFALVKSSCLNLLESALDFYMSHFGTCDVLPFRIFVHIIVLLEKWQPSSTSFFFWKLVLLPLSDLKSIVKIYYMPIFATILQWPKKLRGTFVAKIVLF